LSSPEATPLAGAGGRVRADNFTNKAGTGAPTFPKGANVLAVGYDNVIDSDFTVTAVGYDNVIDSDFTVTSANKTAVIYVDQDLTVDIEEGVTVTVDEGCFLNIIS
jgi:hypothetical protein